MSKKQPKQYGPKTKEERRMEIICASVAMGLMVTLIIILIVGSLTDDRTWYFIPSIVFGCLILITIIVYIVLKVLFMKQRTQKK